MTKLKLRFMLMMLAMAADYFLEKGYENLFSRTDKLCKDIELKLEEYRNDNRN